MNAKIEKLLNMFKAESEARELFNENLEEKYFNLETNVKLMKNESENLQSKISEKNNLPETRILNKPNIKLKWRETLQI